MSEHKGRVATAAYVGDSPHGSTYHNDFDLFVADATSGRPGAVRQPDGALRITDYKGRTFDIVRAMPEDEYQRLVEESRRGR